MKPDDRAAQLTPDELAWVRGACAEAVRENPLWTPGAAQTVADAIVAGDGDHTRAMQLALAGALAMKFRASATLAVVTADREARHG